MHAICIQAVETDFSQTRDFSFYICNTETTIKKTLQIKRKQVSYAHNWKSTPAIMQPHICR